MRNVICKAIMKKGGWVYGYYLPSVDGKTDFIANYSDARVNMPELHIIYSESLCLFSGCLDKFGSKIFENDVVKIEEKVYKVVFESGAFMLEKIVCDNGNYLSFIREMPEHSLEVIGNVYDTAY